MKVIKTLKCLFPERILLVNLTGLFSMFPSAVDRNGIAQTSLGGQS